jgi:lysophospholipase
MRKLGFFPAVLLLIGCMSQKQINIFNTGKDIDTFRNEIFPLDFKKDSIQYPESIIKYFNFYGINLDPIPHYFGTFKVNGKKIVAHIFIPPRAKKSIYVLHGYLLHSGNFNRFIQRMVSNQYAVAIFDLPGHGLSTGEPAHIGDFSEYTQIFEKFLTLNHDFIPKPWIALGHSTGSAIIMDYLMKNKSPFDKHIFIAPLIRSDTWALSRFGVSILGWLIRKVPTMPRDISSDKEYTKFLFKKDPLRSRELPIAWVEALFQWNKKLEESKYTFSGDFLIIQGDKDIGVDWKYNIPFLQERIPQAEIVFIRGGKHELLQESESIRENIFDMIIEYIIADQPQWNKLKKEYNKGY